MRQINTQRTLDATGIWVSALCGLHCVAMPILISTAAINVVVLAKPSIEYIALGLSVTLGVSSLLPSYFRHHRRILPIVLLLMGFILIAVSRFQEDFIEGLFTASGASAIIVGHLLNLRYCKKHQSK